jgi:hypothetical protein
MYREAACAVLYEELAPIVACNLSARLLSQASEIYYGIRINCGFDRQHCDAGDDCDFYPRLNVLRAGYYG